MIKRLIFLAMALWALPVNADTLLPNGKQQFFGVNGQPLIGGSVTFYVPGTTTPKDTFQDAGATISNTNPVHLDSLGSAIIYGSGCYRQIVQDSLNNLIWDQLTCDTASSGESTWGGTSTGTANVQSVVAGNFSGSDGQQIVFKAGLTNTGSMTLTPSGTGSPIPVVKDTPTGTQTLAGGDIVAGNVYTFTFTLSTGTFHTTVPAAVDVIPSGSIMDYAGPSLPTGWLWAAGQCLTQSVYPKLYAAIGGTYGNCGAGTFNTPDYRARVAAGVDNMGGFGTTGRLTTNTINSPTTMGGIGGVELNTLSLAQLPVFTPTGTVTVSFAGVIYNEAAYTVIPSGGGVGTSGTIGAIPATSTAIGPGTFAVSMDPIGSGNPFPVVQPTIMIGKIIKQ